MEEGPSYIYGQREIGSMEQRLWMAAIRGSVESLHEIIAEDEFILDKIIDGYFNVSPLHAAASRGRTQFVKELLMLKIELTEVLDSRNRSALHLASAKGHVEIVHELIQANRNMCLACDQDGRNPLQVAAMEGQVELLYTLYEANHSAIEVRSDQDGTILHLCLKYKKIESLAELLQIARGGDLINAKDSRGNTILHSAVLNGQEEVVELVLTDRAIDINAINADGCTALDILDRVQKFRNPIYKNDKIERELRKANAKRANSLMKFDWLKKRDILMIVTSLIAGAAFQASMNPPGGNWQDDSEAHIAGEAIMSYKHPHLYPYFVSCNTTGFVASICSMFLLTNVFSFGRRTIMWLLAIINTLIITSMALSFAIYTFVVTSEKQKKGHNTTIVAVIIAACSLMALHVLVYTIRLIADVVRDQSRKHEAFIAADAYVENMTRRRADV